MARNNARIQKEAPDLSHTTHNIKRALHSHFEAWEKDLANGTYISCRSERQHSTFSFEVTITEYQSWIGVACVNLKGKLIRAWFSHNVTADPAQGKAKAAPKAARRTLHMDIKHLRLRGDARDIVEDLGNIGTSQTANMDDTIKEARDILSLVDPWYVNYFNELKTF